MPSSGWRIMTRSRNMKSERLFIEIWQLKSVACKNFFLFPRFECGIHGIFLAQSVISQIVVRTAANHPKVGIAGFGQNLFGRHGYAAAFAIVSEKIVGSGILEDTSHRAFAPRHIPHITLQKVAHERRTRRSYRCFTA